MSGKINCFLLPLRQSSSVGTDYIGSYDGTVSALSVADGTEDWAHQTGCAVNPSPTVVDGTVYVGSGDGEVDALSELSRRARAVVSGGVGGQHRNR